LQGIQPGDSLRVVVSWPDGDTCLSANGRRVCGLAPGPGAGWSVLFFNRHIPLWVAAVLNAAWLALLAAPVGYWSPEKRTLAILGGVLSVAVVGASAQGSALSIVDLVTLGAGLALGALGRAHTRPVAAPQGRAPSRRS
jgi:hypothetical protein